MDFEDTQGQAGAWGERARLGFIELSTSVAMTVETPAALPAGVGAVMTRLRDRKSVV